MSEAENELAERELAWAAGFFDGEGCTTVGTNGRGVRYLRVAIHQKTRVTLDRFRAVADVGKVYGPYRHGKGEIFQYQLTVHREAVALLSRLFPYLSPEKRRQGLRRIFETAGATAIVR